MALPAFVEVLGKTVRLRELVETHEKDVVLRVLLVVVDLVGRKGRRNAANATEAADAPGLLGLCANHDELALEVAGHLSPQTDENAVEEQVLMNSATQFRRIARCLAA